MDYFKYQQVHILNVNSLAISSLVNFSILAQNYSYLIIFYPKDLAAAAKVSLKTVLKLSKENILVRLDLVITK